MKLTKDLCRAILTIDGQWHEDLTARAGLTTDECMAWAQLVEAAQPKQITRPSNKLSTAQQRMLRDAYEGNPWARIRGQSAHGGAYGTIGSLVRRGLLDNDYKVTQAGQELLTCTMCQNMHAYDGPDGCP